MSDEQLRVELCDMQLRDDAAFCGTAFDGINSLFGMVSCGQAYRDPIDSIAASENKYIYSTVSKCFQIGCVFIYFWCPAY